MVFQILTNPTTVIAHVSKLTAEADSWGIEDISEDTTTVAKDVVSSFREIEKATRNAIEQLAKDAQSMFQAAVSYETGDAEAKKGFEK